MDVDEPSLLTSWTLDPLQLAPIVLIAVAYAVRARTLARRGQPVPGWRIALFALGIALLVIAVASPIAAVGEEELFSFHMAQHLLLGDLAPLCLLAGLTGPLLRPILALPGVMRLRVLANPFVALPIWAANLVLWHVPFFYEAAVDWSAVHAVEHMAFFSAGIVLWLPVLETLPAPEWFGTGAKLAYIVGVRLVATVIGNVFIWSRLHVLRRLRHGRRLPRPLARRRPEPRRLADDARGLPRHDRRHRVALPADGAGRRGAAGAHRARSRPARGAARRPLPPLERADVIGVAEEQKAPAASYAGAGSKRSFSVFGGTRVG